MSLIVRPRAEKRTKLFAVAGVSLFSLLIVVGVFARNGWFPSTNPLSGKKTGWFGSEPGAVATGPRANPAAPLPTPTPTPQLSKEYIYAANLVAKQYQANIANSHA